MNTRFWGPSGWKILHSITNIYPDKPTTAHKLIMRDFMVLVADILPCKYCRASFTKYAASLDITPFLESNYLIQQWLFKMHNKVNGKLRRQGFCHISNPELDDVIAKYNKIATNHIDNLAEQLHVETLIPAILHYFYILGNDFIGSIIYNYQGYYANCHTNDEKTRIISTYHRFFNMIPILIAQFTAAGNPQCSAGLKHYKIPNFKIRTILQQSEPYSRLKNWFWQCLEMVPETQRQFKSFDAMDSHFQPHIVATCNSTDADKIQSCRKLSKMDRTARLKHKTRKQHTRKTHRN